jgi:hypothetical protein
MVVFDFGLKTEPVSTVQDKKQSRRSGTVNIG